MPWKSLHKLFICNLNCSVTCGVSESPQLSSSEFKSNPCQREVYVHRRIDRTNEKGEIVDDPNKIVGDTTGKDEVFLRGKSLSAQHDFLDDEGKCVGDANSVRGSGTISMLNRFDDNARRARLPRGFVYHSVAPAEAEKAVAPHMQRQSTPSPSLLPRSRPVTDSSSVLQGPLSNTSTRCEILVVDEADNIRSLMAQLHLELLRVWTAKNRGPWLFHRVDSAGLNICTPWRSSNADRLDNDAIGSATTLDEVPIGALKDHTIVSPFFKIDDQSFDSDQIVDRILTHPLQGLDVSIFSQYDYLLTFEERTSEALHTLWDRACDWDVSMSQGRTAKKAPPRIFLLKGTAFTSWIEDKACAAAIYSAICDFARRELGWEEPERSIMDGVWRTSFIQIQLEVQKDRVIGEQGKNLTRIGEMSCCKLYLAKQSMTYGWVVAIVGPEDGLWEAEHLVGVLRDGGEIEG